MTNKTEKKFSLPAIALATAGLLSLICLAGCAEFSDVLKADSSPKRGRAYPRQEKEAPLSTGSFIWPVDGKVTSLFGARRGRDHDGVDIPAPRGAPVRAVLDGVVIHTGRISSYGNLIVLKHEGNIFTAYAHLSGYGVSEGKRVRQGEMIGRVGRTGRARSNHLHFEVRHKTKALDPLKFLPHT